MSLVPTSWVIGGGLAVSVAAFAGGVYTGYQLCDAGYLKDKVKADGIHDEVVAGAQAQDQGAADHEVGRQAVVREIVREVPTIVDRPVYRNDCLDADGLRLLGRAVAAANDGSPVGGATGAAPDVQPTTP